MFILTSKNKTCDFKRLNNLSKVTQLLSGHTFISKEDVFPIPGLTYVWLEHTYHKATSSFFPSLLEYKCHRTVLCMCVYKYIYKHMYIYMYIYEKYYSS